MDATHSTAHDGGPHTRLLADVPRQHSALRGLSVVGAARLDLLRTDHDPGDEQPHMGWRVDHEDLSPAVRLRCVSGRTGAREPLARPDPTALDHGPVRRAADLGSALAAPPHAPHRMLRTRNRLAA